MKTHITNLSIFILLFSFKAYAQSSSAPEFDSHKIIENGIKLYDDKKYDEAVAEFKKVSRNDTNYVLAGTELVNTYITIDKDSIALFLCNDLLSLPSDYVPNLLVYKANALDNLKRSDEAVKVYEEGMQKFPLNYSFTYEMGVMKVRHEKYKEAYDWFVKSMKINPYHANTHFQLGMMGARQGKMIQAMLAWQFYLLIDNTSSRAKTIVSTLEKIAKNEYEFDTPVKIEELEGMDDFSDVETLVKSKVALSPKYKSETKLNFNLTKQIQLVMEKLEVAKDDKGFMMQFYAPFYLELYKKKMLEPFSYSILSGMENKDVDAWVKKNSDKTTAFFSWMVDYLGATISTYEENLNGQVVKARHFYSKSQISAVGNKNAQKENIGYWVYYYSNGIKRSEGAYNDKHVRSGLWKFYSQEGTITDIENYEEGKIEGLVEAYYSNGSIKSHKNFTKGLLDGEQLVYYPTGVKKISYVYKAGVQNGKEAQYHENGKLNYEINVINNNTEGDFVQYFADGLVKQKAAFKEGKRNGKYQEFYDIPGNGIYKEAAYDKGVLTGTYKSYHKNGKLEETGDYDKDGELTGIWKIYNDEGILISEKSYNNGKNAGITKEYGNKGKLEEEYIYKNNLLQEYKAFDTQGKEFYQNKKEGKNNYDVLLFYPNGNKKREGRIENGLAEGTWKNYNFNGYITSVENYKGDKKDGKFIYYYENGKVKSEMNYLNGETDGYYRQYYKNGKVKKEGAYIKGTEVGIWTDYFSDGKPESINFYKDGSVDHWQQYFSGNGKLNYEDYLELDYFRKRLSYDSLGKAFEEVNFDKGTGILNLKFPDGKLSWNINFKNNLKQGVATAYYGNGKVSSTKTYVDNMTNGEAKFYFPSGKIECEETLVNGDLNGKVIHYYENGNIKSTADYLFGEENGKEIRYYPNKQVEVEYSYKNGQFEGKTTQYSESGDLIIIKNFEEDRLVSYQYNDKTGNLVAPVEVKNETGTVKAYYKSGFPSIEYTLKNGLFEGKRITYYPDGKVNDESFFVTSDREGIRKSFYNNGKPKLVENWSSDDKNGDCKYYYESGKIKWEEHYINDKKFGTFKKYDETGKVILTYFYYDDDLLYEK